MDVFLTCKTQVDRFQNWYYPDQDEFQIECKVRNLGKGVLYFLSHLFGSISFLRAINPTNLFMEPCDRRMLREITSLQKKAK